MKQIVETATALRSKERIENRRILVLYQYIAIGWYDAAGMATKRDVKICLYSEVI
jgi:hypothetical protein